MHPTNSNMLLFNSKYFLNFHCDFFFTAWVMSILFNFNVWRFLVVILLLISCSIPSDFSSLKSGHTSFMAQHKMLWSSNRQKFHDHLKRMWILSLLDTVLFVTKSIFLIVLFKEQMHFILIKLNLYYTFFNVYVIPKKFCLFDVSKCSAIFVMYVSF